MSLRLETVDLGLPAIDGLDVEGLALYVGRERPLQGLAGFVDWRLCGQLSRAIQDGRYDPDAGEALLLPTAGRIAVPRLFCFGLPAAPREPSAFALQAARLCDAMQRAGSATWAGELPPVAPGTDLDAGRLFLEAYLPVAPRRVVLLGDARALHRQLSAARDLLHVEVLEVVAPVVRVELPPRAGGLPHPPALLR